MIFRIFALLSFLLVSTYSVFAQASYELNKGWRCAPVSRVKEKGQAISAASFDTSDWLPATVPGTVLTTLLNNKLVPDPFYGMNNEKIPDIFTTGRDHYTYWFVNDFKEKAPVGDEQVWLNLRGVNYSCDLFLNGVRINDSTHYGMFLRQSYNITSMLRKDGANRLAVIVYPPDPVGNPNGGQGGDGMIARNVTHQYVAGWDWIQPIRDRNTGIWDKVFIEKTGAVNISNPHIVTEVPGIRKSGGLQADALLKVSAQLQNATGKAQRGTLEYDFGGKKVSRYVTLAPNERKLIELPSHTITNPKLWWPNGYGQQQLHKLTLRFITSSKTVADREAVQFGIRELATRWNDTTRSREISVNGQRVFIKGGNWIISDQMLRLSASRYDAEVRFHRDMNLNLIRVWGGALMERPEFFEACDKYGLLVFQDFWMTGDCNGRWNDRMKLEDRSTRRKYPDDHQLFLESARDQVRMIRNHPSLAVWCGGNEITPPDDILKALRDSILPELDGTRWFVDASTSDSMSLNTIGGGGDGPYNIQPTDTFWKHRTYPFNSEVGSVGVGDYASLQRFIPEKNLIAPIYSDTPVSRNNHEIVDSVWRYHKYIGYSKFLLPYGRPNDVRDFTRKAQLVNYDQYRSLIEGFSSNMWNWYTGVIIWKTQNPWTSMRGQMYDYYLDPNACLYGLKTGSEPVHIMYNPVSGTIMFTNNSFENLPDYSFEANALSFSGAQTPLAKGSVNLQASSYSTGTEIRSRLQNLQSSEGCFLLLKLYDPKKNLVSENFYWLADSRGNHSGLAKMKQAKLEVSSRTLSPGKLQVVVKNPANNPVSFFNRISLLDKEEKTRLLPAFYSTNYFSVLPGTSKTIVIEYSQLKKGLIDIEAWNGSVQVEF